MSARETPFVFECRGEALLGILHDPVVPARRGVLIVVGGPQYRVGSHRQFVLLARALAAAGIPAMRFDYRGMGDSGGEFRGFEHIDDDIAAAVDAFCARCPGLNEIVMWGLCDAASAALFFAHREQRIRGLVLVNPWVRTIAGNAKTYLKHYYAARLLDPAFWRKLFSGRFAPRASLRAFAGMLCDASRPAAAASAPRAPERLAGDTDRPLPDRMADGLARFSGDVLLIMSGNDFTAREFDEAARASPQWRDLLASPRVTRHDLGEADHTFARRAWRDLCAQWTIAWIRNASFGGTRRNDSRSTEMATPGNLV
jgi:exosortase A-associated hydrolase 1